MNYAKRMLMVAGAVAPAGPCSSRPKKAAVLASRLNSKCSAPGFSADHASCYFIPAGSFCMKARS